MQTWTYNTWIRKKNWPEWNFHEGAWRRSTDHQLAGLLTRGATTGTGFGSKASQAGQEGETDTIFKRFRITNVMLAEQTVLVKSVQTKDREALTDEGWPWLSLTPNHQVWQMSQKRVIHLYYKNDLDVPYSHCAHMILWLDSDPFLIPFLLRQSTIS